MARQWQSVPPAAVLAHLRCVWRAMTGSGQARTEAAEPEAPPTVVVAEAGPSTARQAIEQGEVADALAGSDAVGQPVSVVVEPHRRSVSRSGTASS